MNNLAAFMASLGRNDILLPKLHTWATRYYAKCEHTPALIAAGTRQDANLTIRTFKRREAEYNHHGDDKTKDYFHPSRIGGCPRAAAFGVFGAPSNRTPVGEELLKSHLTFEVGTYFHVLFQNLCSRAGLLLRREVHVQDDVLKIVGHADGILRLPSKALLEIKTINARGYGLLKQAKPEHEEQATLYMGILKLKMAVFVYYNKDTSQLKEFRTTYSSDKFAELVGRIEKRRSKIRQRILPSREGRKANMYPCTFCPFSRVCFDSEVLRAFIAETKIKDEDKGKL